MTLSSAAEVYSVLIPPIIAQEGETNVFVTQLGNRFGSFIPNLVAAILILLAGWLIATIAASVTRGLLNRTNIDDRLANMVMGRDRDQDVPVENWIATAVYWLILIFTLVAFLKALNLTEVSEPLNNLLQQIFLYLPRIGGAALLLGLAWLIATLVKLLVTRGLARFNLDDRLAEQTGEGGSPFLVNETIGDILYWFIFLLFLPLILDALDLQGLLNPVQDLIDQFLSAIPQILTALLVLGVGWFVARIVRGIVTNFLMATGVDRLGTRFGLSATSREGVAVSSLIGTVVYVLILIPVAIVALNELDLEAVSAPAVVMLERALAAIPQIITAGLIIVVSYVVGRFIADLVSSILTSIGFDRVFGVLGLPELSMPTASSPRTIPNAEGQPETTIQTPGSTPSEIVGVIVLVGIVLFGIVTATETLGFAQLTDIVRAIMGVSARVLSGVIVFAIGLYFSNLAFRAIMSINNPQARTLAQAARVITIAFVGAMALQQAGVATDIVNLAFGLLLGAVSVAIAIAFGLGGRDLAAEQMREWLNSFKGNNRPY
ncbi:MAG: mechanosensitive ion channel [Leptolyngbyaceae cyanobacterium SL_1_1]|nr:mechanosensitive ion channel [Leptolyngbyaceae cyanobacterium RM1_1_2]NJO11236.1 mechanosensitive ion channel [Leptolyngbyaceae cyanobacterium SL_1_1]